MAKNEYDIALNENFEIKIVNGDFVIERSDQQNVDLIFLAHKGEFKEFPLIGFGASRFINSTTANKQEFYRDLKEDLKYDGYENPEFKQGIEQIIITV